MYKGFNSAFFFDGTIPFGIVESGPCLSWASCVLYLAWVQVPWLREPCPCVLLRVYKKRLRMRSSSSLLTLLADGSQSTG